MADHSACLRGSAPDQPRRFPLMAWRNHALPYGREEKLGEKLGQVLKDIYIPDDILAQLENSLVSDNGRQELLQKQQRERLEQRLGSVRQRFDRAYTDKLDGKISEEFWERKVAEWQAEGEQIQVAVQSLEQVKPERILDAVKILELANKAYFLYLKQTPTEKAKLLRLVLSNCAMDAVSVYPNLQKAVRPDFPESKK
jgi:hypothetical protein